MLKFLLIVFLVGYVIFKVTGFLFRTVFINAYKAQQRSQQFDGKTYQRSQAGTKKQPKDGNVSIDMEPSSADKRSKRNFGGGEYVDYEEVK